MARTPSAPITRKKSQAWRGSLQPDRAEYDVIIVGAGPAGLMAADTLINSDRSPSILIVDRNEVHYDKPCGGGVPKDCLEEFPFLRDKMDHQTIELIAIYKEHRKTFPVELDMIPRERMRTTMLGMVDHDSDGNVDIMFNSIVTDIDIEHRQITVNKTFIMKYNWLIGADGVNSVVAKAINFKFQKVPLIVTSNQAPERIQRGIRAEFIFLEDLPGGYFWFFPKGKCVNIGMGGNIKGSDLQEKFDYYFRILGYKEYQTTFRSAHLIPSEYNYNPQEESYYIEQNQIILCGDAATFINPMTGEGIYYALKSGKEAAEVVLSKWVPFDYPSFHKYLSRVQRIKDDIEDLPIREAFEKILMDDETSQDTVEFLFSHHIPEPKKLSEEAKDKIYKNL